MDQALLAASNGKVERFNSTLAAEWAYAKHYTNEADRAEAWEVWPSR